MAGKVKKYLFAGLGVILLMILILAGILGISYANWKKESVKIFYEIKSLNNSIKGENNKYFNDFSIRIYDVNNNLLSTINQTQQNYVELSKIPSHIIDLLLLKEDQNFYKHSGVNFGRIIKSLLVNIRYGRVAYGGSTITQQVAKLLFTNSEKTVKRKIFEMYTSWYIEKLLTKNEILEIYSNIVYLGFGRYGFEAGSQFYFNKHVWELNFEEACMLVSIISAPERFSPLKNLELAKKKFNVICVLAKKNGLITPEYSARIQTSFWETYNISKIYNEVYIREKDVSPWVTNYVIEDLSKNFGLDNAFKGNYQVYTTFDSNALIALEDSKASFFSKKNLFDDRFTDEEFERLEVAAVTINPQTGGIIAFTGGKRYSPLNQFNRAVKAYRQPGSSFKPYLYLYAIEQKKITPSTMIEDAPIKMTVNNKNWEPKNYGNKYYGDVPVFFALKKSLNTVSVRIMQMINLDGFVGFLGNIFKKVTPDILKRIRPYPSLALGSVEMSPLEMAAGYSTFANGGYSVKPYYLKEIVSGSTIVYEHQDEERTSVFDEKYGKMIMSLLQFPLTEGGTGYYAKLQNNFYYPSFGKTGTTNDGRDSWFMSITGNTVTSVWIGFDQGEGNSLLTGGTYSARLYYSYIKKIYQFYLHDYSLSDEGLISKFVDFSLLNINVPENPQVQLLYDRDNYPYDFFEKLDNAQQSIDDENPDVDISVPGQNPGDTGNTSSQSRN